VIDEGLVQRVLGAALRTGADFAELFVEDRRSSAAVLDDGRVEQLNSGRSRGAGIRVITGETTGFAHTAELSERGLLAAAEAAAAAARGGGPGTRTVDLSRQTAPTFSVVETLPETVAKAHKVELLRRADDAARRQGGDVKQVTASYSDGRRKILVANSDGLLAGDDQVRTRFAVQSVAVGDTGMQTGFQSVGRTVGFELFSQVDVDDIAARSAQQALRKLAARPAPSGELPVVIKAGRGAVLFHEACGHPLEADLVGKGASVFKNRVGERVASEHVTLIDDAAVAGEWGCYSIDDEGRPAERSVLIENGMLTDYMYDFLRARKEGRLSSSNGRRQTYQHLPMVRMTNTFLQNGDDDPDEIVRQTPYGVYLAALGGGQVNTASGDFVFGMTEAYMIEDGQITYPIRDANLIGSGADVLAKIDAVANDFAMAPGGGMCGKDGQSAPVGMGQPTLRVSAMTIGGTAGA
jgi:TldD protein